MSPSGLPPGGAGLEAAAAQDVRAAGTGEELDVDRLIVDGLRGP
ncbi:hypothetical protein [Streptomyces doebereineriae]|uniref:Uncharacterized protein n=1 Tax=Streptomyces doebereineriae TaxID=3075528 RepID=A0ABU2V6H5_9ACTN|nr:hypothetical protein [Streptomyces sp. DSM 41640]MDT0481161.1 hypothetical protein [Streptomyces sp. DSM 41640]